jgi:predicted lipoprotein with Yx(FWY)xxD motif
VTYQTSDGGVLLGDPNGITLYMFDQARRAGRGMQRPQDWKPVVAKADDKPVGNWGIVERDGVRQWTHRGFLVFTSVHDKYPGDLHGVRNTDAMWRTIMRSGEVMDGTGF